MFATCQNCQTRSGLNAPPAKNGIIPILVLKYQLNVSLQMPRGIVPSVQSSCLYNIHILYYYYMYCTCSTRKTFAACQNCQTRSGLNAPPAKNGIIPMLVLKYQLNVSLQMPRGIVPSVQSSCLYNIHILYYYYMYCTCSTRKTFAACQNCQTRSGLNAPPAKNGIIPMLVLKYQLNVSLQMPRGIVPSVQSNCLYNIHILYYYYMYCTCSTRKTF